MPLVPCRRLEFPVSLERGAHHFLFAQGLADAAPGPGGAPSAGLTTVSLWGFFQNDACAVPWENGDLCVANQPCCPPSPSLSLNLLVK